jgi:endonuclease YncB( thermonuclease family)
MKRLLTLFILVFAITLLASCDDKEETVVLPDLTGMTRVEAVSALTSLKLKVTTAQVIDDEREEGVFSHYGNDLSSGDSVSLDERIVVYIVQHTEIDGVRLPDLTGLDEDAALDILLELELFVTIDEVPNNDVEIGLFSNYGDGLLAGDIVEENTAITVYFAIEQVFFNEQFIISKYLEGSGNNRALELFNASDETIDLELYGVALYLNGDESPTRRIDLDGTLEPGDTIVIVHGDAEPELKAKADLISNDLVHDGNDTIAITYRDDYSVDILGTIGFQFYYLSNQTLVRKPDIIDSKLVYNNLDWDVYALDNHEMFGEHPVDFPAGFTFDESFLELDYFTEQGGMVEVTYVYANDGDTSYFDPHFSGDKRVRFVGIDTPEMTPTHQPWAPEATAFVRDLLDNAETIYVQHDPASGRTESYGRYLGLIWVDGQLLNYLVVQAGFSENKYYDESEFFVFNGVSLNYWFRHAEQEAKEAERGLWS